MSKFAVRITQEGPANNLMVLLRKYNGLGLTEIKNIINNKDYLAETDGNDIDEMARLKGLIDGLMKLGAEVKIFDSDQYGEGIYNFQQISYEEFINSIDRLKEITEELQDFDDAVSEED